MKKALLGRRLFASLMPAAPAIVGEVGRGVADKLASTTEYPTPPSPIGLRGMNKVSPRINPPATYAKYREAENAVHKLQQFRYERANLMNNGNRMDPNIMALKSVSRQHKVMMHMKQEAQERERTRTFLEQLQDVLGLREYFKMQQETHADSPGAATGGY